MPLHPEDSHREAGAVTGVYGSNGASMHLDNVSVENSEYCGVSVSGSQRNTMKNCNVSHSKRSGLLVHDGLMTVSGNATTIHHNGTDGYSLGIANKSFKKCKA